MSIAKTKRHHSVSKCSIRAGEGGFLLVLGINRNLKISPSRSNIPSSIFGDIESSEARKVSISSKIKSLPPKGVREGERDATTGSEEGTCLEASPYSTLKDMGLEVDENYAQESQKKKHEHEEAQKV
nr:hypothetical protein [Tanacetum cinerariifolium]